THCLEHVPEVLGIGHLEGEPAGGDAFGAGRHRGRQDVDVLVGQDSRDVGEQPRAVERLDLDGHQEHAVGGGRPLDLDDTAVLLAQRVDVDAVHPVDRHAGATGDEPDDLVTGYRGAASGELDPHVRDTLDHHARVGTGAAPRAIGGGGLGDVLGGAFLAAQDVHEFLHDALRRDVPLADGSVQ